MSVNKIKTIAIICLMLYCAALAALIYISVLQPIFGYILLGLPFAGIIILKIYSFFSKNSSVVDKKEFSEEKIPSVSERLIAENCYFCGVECDCEYEAASELGSKSP